MEIEAATMEIDGGLEMLDVAEATGGLLHPLDRRIKGFDSRIGDAMLQIGEHVGEVTSDELRHLCHRSQSTMGRPPEPAGKVFLGGTTVGIIPELPEALFECPGPGHLELAARPSCHTDAKPEI